MYFDCNTSCFRHFFEPTSVSEQRSPGTRLSQCNLFIRGFFSLNLQTSSRAIHLLSHAVALTWHDHQRRNSDCAARDKERRRPGPRRRSYHHAGVIAERRAVRSSPSALCVCLIAVNINCLEINCDFSTHPASNFLEVFFFFFKCICQFDLEVIDLKLLIVPAV